MNQNKVFLIGRITKDPEVKSLSSGTLIANFVVATNHIFKDKSGEKKETAQFHNCAAFSRLAEIIKQYVVKGQEVAVEGRIDYQQWEKDGEKKSRTQIIVEAFQMGQKPRYMADEKAEEKSILQKGIEETKGKKKMEVDDDIPIIEEGEINVGDIKF